MSKVGPSSIIFVRHAYTEWNTAKITMGQTDIPASSEGMEAAEFEADGYSSKPSWIVSSPLKRALSTAEVFAHVTGLHVQIDPVWMERDWGPYQGHLKSIRPESGYLEGVEPWGAFLARIAGGLGNLPHDGEGMVVSHSGVFKALLIFGYQSKFKRKPTPYAQPIKLTLNK